jgi:methyltransferase (TIGR00027 family)
MQQPQSPHDSTRRAAAAALLGFLDQARRGTTMEERPSSQTARNVAVWRALHLLRDPEPKIFEDVFARGLAGYDSDSAMLSWVEKNPRASDRNTPFSFALRHRYTEDQLRRAIAMGVDQYVILGAGLDSFAYRHPDLVGKVDVFEVDHPASQQWKRNRVARLGLPVPDRLHYVPVDFERQTLTDELIKAGLERLRPAFFSCLGVTQYLTPKANLDLFAQVGRLTITNTLAVEFIAPPEMLASEDGAIVNAIAEGTAAMGEPWLSYFSFDEMEAVLRGCGFTTLERFGAVEAVTRYALRRSTPIPGYFRMITATSS